MSNIVGMPMRFAPPRGMLYVLLRTYALCYAIPRPQTWWTDGAMHYKRLCIYALSGVCLMSSTWLYPLTKQQWELAVTQMRLFSTITISSSLTIGF